MLARLKRWGFIGLLAVIVVAGIFVFLWPPSVGPPPVSIKYVGRGRFKNGPLFSDPPNAGSVRSGPTFAITNLSSKTQLFDLQMMVRNGTNWSELPFNQSISLAPNTGTYFTMDASMLPTNTWRLHGLASEALRGPVSVASRLGWLLQGNPAKLPISEFFSPNRTWWGQFRHFNSEEVIDPKSRQ